MLRRRCEVRPVTIVASLPWSFSFQEIKYKNTNKTNFILIGVKNYLE